MSKLEPELAAAIFTARPLVPAALTTPPNVQPMNISIDDESVGGDFLDHDLSVADPEMEGRSRLTDHDAAGAQSALLRDTFSEYYDRGIHILRPEIVLASEFVPIVKNKNELPGLKIKNGSKNVNVNQVFRLLELHQSVQKSMNMVANDLIDSISGCDAVLVYQEAKNHFAENLVKNTLSETVDAYVDKLSNNLVDLPVAPEESRRNKSWGSLLLDSLAGTSNPNSDTTEDETEYTTFRDILIEGSEIEKISIRRLLEIIVIEKMSLSIFSFLNEIVTLKEDVIPKKFSMLQLGAGCRTPASDYSFFISPTAVEYLAANFSLIKTSNEMTDPTQAVDPFGGGTTGLGAFQYVDYENLCAYGLGVQGAVGFDNYSMIHGILKHMFSILTFSAPGVIHRDKLRYMESAQRGHAHPMLQGTYIKEADVEKYKEIITNFRDIGAESFFRGNVISPGSNDNRLVWFTSVNLNEKTVSKSLKYALPTAGGRFDEDGNRTISVNSILATMAGNSSKCIDLSESLNSVIKSIGYLDEFDVASELVALSVFDMTYSINRATLQDVRAGTSDRYQRFDAFGNKIDTSWNLNSYASKYTGHPLDESYALYDKLKLDDPTGWEHDLGYFGDLMMRMKHDDTLDIQTMPGSNTTFGYPGAIPGDKALPLIAFQNADLDDFNDHVKQLEKMTSYLIYDIGQLTSIFHDSNDWLIKCAKGTTPTNPGETLLKIFSNFADVLDDDKNKLGRALAIMSAAAEDDKLLASSFATAFFRKAQHVDENDGYYPSDTAMSALRLDASNRALTRFFSFFGKSLSGYANTFPDTWEDAAEIEDYLSLDVSTGLNLIRDIFGQQRNYFPEYGAGVNYQENGIYDGDTTFLDADKFDDSSKTYGGKPNEAFESSRAESIEMVNNTTAVNGVYRGFAAALQAENLSIQDASTNQVSKFLRSVDLAIKDMSSQDFNDLKEGYYSTHANIETFVMSKEDEDNFNSKHHMVSINRSNYDLGKMRSHHFRTTTISRQFAFYALFCKIINHCVKIKVEFKSDGKKMRIQYDKVAVAALKDALKGISFQEGKDSLSSDQLKEGYKTRRDRADAILKKAKKPVFDRINSTKVVFASMYGHINNLYSLKNEIKRSVSESSLSRMDKLAIKHYGLKNTEGNEENALFANAIVQKNLLASISSRTMATYYKNFAELISNSRSGKFYPSSQETTRNQLRQMQLAFSEDNFGMISSEKFGKKTIINVGIPPGALDHIALESDRHSSEGTYSGSPYICLHIFKKDALGGNIKYYPKPFFFNTLLFGAENFDFFGMDLTGQEANAGSIETLKDLQSAFTLYKYSKISNKLVTCSPGGSPANLPKLLAHHNDLKYMDLGESGIRATALKELRNNHINDYYLKMYMRMSTGIDVNEYVFPLSSEDKITGEVDASAQELFNFYRKDLFLKFPSVNVDPVLAREYVRLEKNVKFNKFFSLDSRVKNIFASKCFERVFSVFVNESDFVVYPYPELIRNIQDDSELLSTLSSYQPFIRTLPDLYEPCPYFPLDSSRQIYGINNNKLGEMAGIVENPNVFSSFSNLNSMSTNDNAYDMATGKSRQFIKHMNEIRASNSADVYEFFAVVTVVRSK